MNNISLENFIEELQAMINAIVTKLQELERVHTLRLDHLLARVEELEQWRA
ncbi:hypothetical protein PI95_026785 [Hassallia byssoidea VB512170]|uniref:Uncharacterized protein n=1 Tax=Hassallia byssoidea VB512170 TaxID=1304833 RepID=A0A846HHG5_9CYAN|nr:hypothetical protein [Hassalia byssoidea]NEU76060.1 hypothetical protein [Hassalia byssoidea VB512170]